VQKAQWTMIIVLKICIDVNDLYTLVICEYEMLCLPVVTSILLCIRVSTLYNTWLSIAERNRLSFSISGNKPLSAN